MNDELTNALGLGRRKPATEKTLQEAWERWHFLGDIPHKHSLLITTSTYRWPSEMVEAAARLKDRFGGFLNPVTHEKAIQLIEIWESLQTSIRTTRELHAELIESNLRWEHLDDQTTGRLAIVRAIRHVQLLKEFDPEARTPQLKHIRRLYRLYGEYSAAHTKAMGLLMDIGFPASLRTRRIIRKRHPRSGRIVEIDATVEDHPRGLGIPRTVPWETEIAQLAALKRVSRSALEKFMSSRFLNLPCREQIRFIMAMHAEPRRARNKCGTIAPWLADNAPLLHLLRNQWNDVDVLVRAFFPVQYRPANLRTFASKHGVMLGFKPGGNYVNRAGLFVGGIRPLLTPPVVLK